MASTFVKSNRLKRMESKKSHSWWWDSHISSKNSKWLLENLEEMDEHVKRMLKLIEEDADSFAKKAEMYYQKRPELISLVERFYRMYRALAERYDHATGDIRKTEPSDIQSQGSGVSDVGSEPPSAMPSPDRRPSRRKSGPRAAGFDFFLGKEKGDGSNSTSDSESESDDSSINNYSSTNSNDEDQGLQRKILELEAELCEVKEKLRVQEESIFEEVESKIPTYEEELKVAEEKIQSSEEEITRLKIELQKYKSGEDFKDVRVVSEADEKLKIAKEKIEEELKVANEKIQLSGEEIAHLKIELQKCKYSDDMLFEDSKVVSEAEVQDSVNKIQTLENELRIALQKLQVSEVVVVSKSSSIQNLQEQLKLAEKEIFEWKNKLEKETREVSKMNDRTERYKTSLSEREQEIRILKEAMSHANKCLSEENEQLKAETTRLLKEQTYLEDNLKESDLRRQSLEAEVRRIMSEKAGAEVEIRAEIEKLKDEKNNLSTKIDERAEEIRSKDEQIEQMRNHLHQLHMAHVELIVEAEGARKKAKELLSRVKELELEVERKEETILEGAEEKREAIRQLCLSVEHYRNGYNQLRLAVIGQKRLPVKAS
ncbi:hypothetical protein ACJIZ3_017816 [Penstemon smallii]|uniref:NAB domain-containing protein n=1 Tax=Penstemon smallii TaxID=265156 RepID=A0ABD3SWM7_9LAMI